MPQKMRLKISITLALCLILYSSTAQKYNCNKIDDSGLITKAFTSFEKDIFNHYNFGNDTIKTYRTFLAEVASLSIDIKKLPSKNSIQLARSFKNKATTKNSIWITLSDYENHEASTVKKSNVSKKDPNEEEILIFNYRDGFIQCLKNNSEIPDFKDLINSLENNGNISTSLVSQKIYYFSNEELNTIEVKEFIAFDIYYSILLVIEKIFN